VHVRLRAHINSWPAERAALAALCTVALIWVAYVVSHFWWRFGGDPEIHIIFARNFLEGHFLEFNPGYKSGGETSPLYMIIVAAGYRLLGAYVPYGMKALAYLSFATICYLLLESNEMAPPWRRWSFVLLAACMPFFVFQASLGMENMLFAAAVVAIVHIRCRTADPRVVLGLPAVVPVLFFLRPEAVFIALWLGCLAAAERRIAAVMSVIVSVGVTYALYVALNRYTGVETHNAGLIRAYLSTLSSVRIPLAGHDVFVSTKVLVGMSYALPFLAYAGFNYRALSSRDILTLGTLFFVPAGLHFFDVLPNIQFSRYFLFEYGVLLYVFASRFLATISSRALVGIWLVTASIGVAEVHSRAGDGVTVSDSIRETSPQAVKAYSDALFAALHPGAVPVSIASQEVELRARVDARFIVWSLDGITDYRLGNHLQSGYIDHFGYIRDRNIEFVQGLEDYNRDKHKPSLNVFQPTAAHTPTPCIEGLRLEPTTVDKIFRVIRCGSPAPLIRSGGGSRSLRQRDAAR
jgi:hypothetical protein